MKDTQDREYPIKAKCPVETTSSGEIITYLERIEKELEVQYQGLSQLESEIGPIIREQYPACDEVCVSGDMPETKVGVILSKILSKISDRNHYIDNLINRVRL